MKNRSDVVGADPRLREGTNISEVPTAFRRQAKFLQLSHLRLCNLRQQQSLIQFLQSNHKMTSTKPPPSSISGYLILALRLPATTFTPAATHYLYLRRHEPKNTLPTDEDERSLFAVNVPIDATDAHLRALFAGIGGGRVESVRFDSAPPASPQPVIGKRKRGKNDDGEDGEVEEVVPLPSVWDRNVYRSGGTAVVLFVDRSSLDMTLRAVEKAIVKARRSRKVKKGGKKAREVMVEEQEEEKDDTLPVWGSGVPADVPKLGIARTAPPAP